MKLYFLTLLASTFFWDGITELVVQDEKCLGNLFFYENYLNQIKKKKEKNIIIKFNFKISNSLVNSMVEANIIDSSNIGRMLSILKMDYSDTCQGIQDKLKLLKAKHEVSGIKNYTLSINFSKPFLANNRKTYVIVEALSLNSGGYLNGGVIILLTFEDNNDTWELVEEKLLEQY